MDDSKKRKDNSFLDLFKREKVSEEDEKSRKRKRPKLDKEVIHVMATEQEQQIFLDAEKQSWLRVVRVEPPVGLSMAEFEELFALRPQRKLQIRIAGRLVDCPRYSASYLRSYTFSGLEHAAEPGELPARLARLLAYCRRHYDNGLGLNQSLVNWYEADGSIGPHSDDTRPLVPHSDIFSFSFGPATRSFLVEPKQKQNNSSSSKSVCVQLEHNTLVIMGGKCQTTHRHSVPKQTGSSGDGRRLNVTFRCFKK
mgnify:CR=1 FL=1